MFSTGSRDEAHEVLKATFVDHRLKYRPAADNFRLDIASAASDTVVGATSAARCITRLQVSLVTTSSWVC